MKSQIQPEEGFWAKNENLVDGKKKMEKENIKSIKKSTDPWTGPFWMKRPDRSLGTRTTRMKVIIELKSLIIRERMEKHMAHIKQKSEDKLLGNGSFMKNIAKLLRY